MHFLFWSIGKTGGRIAGLLLALVLFPPSLVQAAPDLFLAVRDQPDPVGVSTNLAYIIGVTNRGSSAGTGIELTNLLPSSVTFISTSPSEANCAHANGVVRCALGTLNAGQGTAVTITARPNASGVWTNHASVGSIEADAAPADNQAFQATSVLAFLPTLSNTTPISFADELVAGPAMPYPSTIFVSGVTAAVFKVVVTLSNANHTFPDDLDVVLVGPGGQNVLLMSDAGGGFFDILENATLTFDDDASMPLPDATKIVSGTYRPTNYGTLIDEFASPGPAGPHGSALSVFQNTDPNGPWSLYVMDDLPEDSGSINNGWRLRLVTRDPLADLVVTQSDSPDPANVLSNLAYTITVTNRGPAAANGVTVVDQLPGSVGFASASSTQGNCAHEAGRVVCSLGSLANGAGARIIINVTPFTAGIITNTATAASNGIDVHPADDSTTNTTTVRWLTDLSLTQTSSPAPALLEQPLTYQLFVTNHGPHAAMGVTLTNRVPSGTTFVSATAAQGGCTHLGGGITCNLGSLGVNAGTVVTLTVRPTREGTITNAATAITPQFDFNPGNNTHTHLATVLPAADLVLSQSDAPDPVLATGTVTYSLTVSNRGPSLARDVMLSELVPANANLLSFTNSQDNCTNMAGLIVCNFGDLAVNAIASLQVLVRTTVDGTLTNLASAASATGDPNVTNNASSALTTVQPAVDLAVFQSDWPDPAPLNKPMTYTVRVTNAGPSRATGIMLTNDLPPEVRYLSATSTQGNCAHADGRLVCALGSLARGEGASLQITVRPAATGPLTNRAAVFASESELNQIDNVSEEVTTAVISAGLFSNSNRIDIGELGPAAPYPAVIFVSGVTIRVDRVTVTLSNLNHSYPDDLDVLLVAPSGQTLLLLSDAGGEVPLNNVTLTFSEDSKSPPPDGSPLLSGGYLPANYGTAEDTFAAPAPPAPYGTTLTGLRHMDPNGTWSLFITDDAAKDHGFVADGWNLEFSTLMPIADLAVQLRGTSEAVARGSNFTYTVLVTNGGPSRATGVVLTNLLPAAFSLASMNVSDGICTNRMGTISCDFGEMAFEETALLTLQGSFSATGSFTNRAVTAANEAAGDPANDVMTIVTRVLEAPVITQQPQSITITNGSTASFMVTATGSPPLRYQWRRNGINLAGQTNAALVITNAQSSDEGGYSVRVSNEAAAQLSGTALLTVQSPPVIVLQPQSRTNFAGSTATFNVGAIGTAPIRYQWYFNQTNVLAGATNATLSVADVQTNQSGLYHVVLNNPVGVTTSALARLTVWRADFGDAPVFFTPLANGGAFHLADPTLFLGEALDFEPDGQPNPGATGDDTAGVDDEDGVDFPVPLRVGQAVSVALTASTNGYLNAWMDFSANGSWSEPGEQIATNYLLVPGPNTLNLRVPPSAVPGPTFARFRFSSVPDISFSGGAPDGEVEDYRIILDPVADLAVTMTDLPDPVRVGEPLTYSVVATNLGPSRSASPVVRVNLPSGANLQGVFSSQAACHIESGVVVCSLSSLGPNQSGLITVIVVPTVDSLLLASASVSASETDFDSENNSVNTTTSAQHPPAITTQPESQSTTNGGTVTFSVIATGTALQYQWFFNEMALPGQTDSTLVLSNAQPSDGGSYRVWITNGVGSVMSQPAGFVLLQAPDVTTAPASGITSTSAVLQAVIVPHGLPTTAWFEWGTSTNFNQMSEPVDVGSGTDQIAINALVMEFEPNTNYQFRAVATNSLGRTDGNERTFAWIGNPGPRFTLVEELGGNMIRVEFAGNPGQIYEMQGSTNLINWDSLGAPSSAGSGTFRYEEPIVLPYRFYRAWTP